MDDPLVADLRARAHEHPLLAEAAQRIDDLRAALQPFAELGKTVLEVHQDPEPAMGWVWGGREQHQHITVWFGPTDFGRAIAAHTPASA